MKELDTFRADIERAPSGEQLTRLLVVGFGLVAAVGLGYLIGSYKVLWLILLGVVAVVSVVVAGFHQRAWMLILLGWAFSGGTLILRVPVSIRDIAIMLAFGAYIGCRLLSERSMRQKTHVLDWLLIVNLAWIAMTFIRNPVGVRALGSEMIGGRAYFNVALATLAFWVILRLPNSVKLVSRFPYFLLAGAFVVSLLNGIGYLFPSLTPHLYSLYSGLDVEWHPVLGTAQQNVNRLKGVGAFGVQLILVLAAFCPPPTLFDPRRGRFYALLLGVSCILASGFRNYMLWGIVALGIGALLHRGWRGLAIVVTAGGLLLGALLLGQGRVYELAHSVQRTLTWLPGKWSPVAIADAEGSTQVRIDWWQEVIRYRMIQNWWLGDGFGIRSRDLMLAWSQRNQVEAIYLSGMYHSGPLSAIRFVGIIGLGFLYVLMISTAVYSVQCVRRCRGTVLLPAATFVAIQALWEPIHYTFVYGAYDARLPESILLLALVRLLLLMSGKARAQQSEQDLSQSSAA